MTREAFRARHEESWQRLERMLRLLERRKNPERKRAAADYDPLDWAEFDRTYRSVCLHLSLARSRCYGAQLEGYLNDLVLRAHHQLYGRRRGLGRRIVRYAAQEFPARIRREWRAVLLSAALFLGPALAVGAVLAADPDLVHSILPPEQLAELRQMYAPDSDYRTQERAAATDVVMFGYYVQNNTGIGFRTFAGGILFGIGTAFFLVFNGAFIAAVVAYLTQQGFSGTLYPFLVGHSSLELTAIVFAGAAGLKLAGALFSPGRRPRGEALRLASVEAIGILYGTAGMFVLAAFVEAFWSASTAPVGLKFGVGAGLWVVLLGYFALAGRTRAA